MQVRKQACKEATEERLCDLAIIGSGPAGLSAAIYGTRSGLSCLVLEKGVAGGQVMLAPWIENYPGFPRIEGLKLVEAMVAHAREYVDIKEGAEVVGIEREKNAFKLTTTSGIFRSRSVLLATGAVHKKLLIPGEEEYYGKGVSYCATCDGFFFRKKKVVVVGGGNTALTDALYLHSIGCDVTIIHRRDSFRADRHLQEAVAEKKIDAMLNTIIERINGDGAAVRSVDLRDTKTGKITRMELDGVFIAVGTTPSSALAKAMCVELDSNGFVKVDRNYRTNVPFVYAAGDVTGGIMQVVAAVHGGAVAALSAFEDLANPYYTRTRTPEADVCNLEQRKI
jgi:thioredoxin reductase (NADPH)